MEVVKPWEEVEVEVEVEADVEDNEVALRGRLPRQHSTTNTTITTTTTITTFKVGDDSSTSSDSFIEEANGTPRNGASDHGQNGDTKSTNGHSGFDERYADFLVSVENPADQTLEVKTEGSKVEEIDVVYEQHEVEAENNGSAAFSPSPSPPENGNFYVSLSNGTGTAEHEEANTRRRTEEEEDDEKEQELELQRLYQRQGQHEFVCPNCRACITKVLVRERELENRPPSSPPPQRVRCTSCFSFLSLAGKIFWPCNEEEDTTDLGDSGSAHGLRERPRDQRSQAAPGKMTEAKQTAVFSATGTTQPLERDFEMPSQQNTEAAATTEIPEHKLGEIRPNKHDSEVTYAEAGSTTIVLEHKLGEIRPGKLSSDNSNGITGLHVQVPSIGVAAVLEPSIGTPVVTTKPLSNNADGNTGVQEQVPSIDSNEALNEKKHPVWELFRAIFSAKRFGGNLEKHGRLKVPLLETKGTEVLDPVTPLPDQAPEVTVTVTTKPVASGINVAVSTGRPTHQEGIIPDIAVEENRAGRLETIIDVPSRERLLVPEQDSSKSWEILKSIVYGGLTESIASLGIVTSAAGGDASTLNIVSLALANLLGGLFIIVHNIWELKDDQSKVHCSRTKKQVDKYEEVLGRRENFVLHAFFAILSFLIFGLAPPVVYGLSFRQTDDKDLKLAAVAVASLVCITLLAVGKAQTQNPHKYFKTVTYYVVVGLGVSGVSYLAGQLINQLIEKFESSESIPGFTPPLPGMGAATRSWGSY